MVSASDWLSAAVGMAMLEQGGNAFDAAVASGFALQVVEPHMAGPSGELVALLWSAAEGRARVLSGQGPAPAGATLDNFAAEGLDLVPGSGLLPAPVPGAFDAWLLMLRDYGTMRLRDALSPAIGYAQQGCPLLPDVVRRLTQSARTFREQWPGSASIYLRTGSSPRAFDLHRNPTMAATYQRILAEAEAVGADRIAQIEAARSVWRHGFVAEEIDRFVRTPQPDLTGVARAGVLTGDDMNNYRATYEEPAGVDWGDRTVLKPGAWTQGPVFLQQLALLTDYLDGDASREFSSPEDIHVFVESAKLAYADRDAYYGDVPDVPLDALLSAEYTAERRAALSTEASRVLRPGRVGGHTPTLPAAYDHYLVGPAAVGTARGSDLDPLGRDTCHVDVMDKFGNVVAVTSSGGFFMTSPVVPALGFPLACRLEMSWLQDGLPNTLRPGNRPRTTLSPTMVLRDGEPSLVFGSPGADLQEQWSLAFLIRTVQGIPVQQAVELPNFHTEHLIGSFAPHKFEPGSVTVELEIPKAAIDELTGRGHDVIANRSLWYGRVSAIGRDSNTGLLFAAADPRHAQAYACGR